MQSDTLLACGKLLITRKLTIAFAESATAGRMASEFSLLPDAGKFLIGGLVCYDACLKEQLLKVPGEMIKKLTPESMEVTMAIANGLERLIPASLHIGITGLTSTGGSETPEKPVGTMFIHAVLHGRALFSERVLFQGSPEEIVKQTTEYTAALLVSSLSH